MTELALKYESRTMTHGELMALPVSFSLATGAKAFGIGRTLAYELHREGKFPCRVMKIGNSLKVTRADLFRALGMTDEPASGDHTQAFAHQPSTNLAEPSAEGETRQGRRLRAEVQTG